MRKKILNKVLMIGLSIVVEGVISIAAQGIRECSRCNYNGLKDNARQINNIRKNSKENPIIDIDLDLL